MTPEILAAAIRFVVGKRVRWPGGEGVIVQADATHAVVREDDGREERVGFGVLSWVAEGKA